MTGTIAAIDVIGAGAWGTALAQLAAEKGHAVRLWAYEAEVAAAIDKKHENPLYLPDIPLSPAIRATDDIAAMGGADALLLVVPAQHLRGVAGQLASRIGDGAPAVICSKGIEEVTGKLMSEVLAEALPRARPAVLSGPTFASEVARGNPTAVTIAAEEAVLADALAAALGSARFRPYAATDMAGAEIGGSVKNVIAIACGIVAGLGLGQNARAALMTRGLAEMTRLALAKGGAAETMMGLAGIGDLALTCASESSRNYSLGVEIGRGAHAAEVLASRRTVAEGAYTAGAVVRLARALDVEMPISEAINSVIHEGADLEAVIQGLLARPFKREGLDG